MNKIVAPDSFSKISSLSESNVIDVNLLDDSEEMNHGRESVKNSKCDEIMDSDEKGFENNLYKSSHVTNNCESLLNSEECSDGHISVNDSSSSEYEIVSLNVKNMTQTTVINTTYNISQSTLTDTGDDKTKASSMIDSNPSFTKSNILEKSRVVVQVLTNSKKSVETQAIENIKNGYEYPAMYSFRDDVFKILSKSQPTKVKYDNCTVVKDTPTQEPSIDKSPKKLYPKFNSASRIIKSRSQKHKLKFYFGNGRGIKIKEIRFISSNLRNASARLLRILHYVLYDTYGPCDTGLQLIKTKRNILNFCGYPFDKKSESCLKKKNCLLKLPLPILTEIYQIFVKNECRSRFEMVSELMEFFLKPENKENNSENDDASEKAVSMEELIKLALRTPLPTVSVKKLSELDIQKIQHVIKSENSLETDINDEPLPIYILNGPGQKLKSFPQIVDNLLTARNKLIKMLHYILYGRFESAKICRRNVLEFSGFLPCQKEFTAERKKIIDSLSHAELGQMCKIFCLHAKTNSRSLKINKIISYLRKPREPVQYKYFVRRKDKEERPDASTKFRYSQPSIINGQEKAKSSSGPKLRDFKNICYNIECAVPSDLTELNDLLFVKPCDESEIHQRILDFTGFDFLTNSLDYHYRKTLMHYMSFCVIRKVAQLLDIRDQDKVTNQDDLADSILGFLMEMKLSDLHNRKMPNCKLYPEKNIQNLKHGEKKSEPDSILQMYNRGKGENQRFETTPEKSPQNDGFSLDHAYSAEDKTDNCELNNKPVIQCKRRVFIHRLSKAPVQTQIAPEKTNGSICTEMFDDDSTPLRAFLHHPSDQELQKIIRNIIEANLWSFTMRDLIQKVYCCYPDFNLKYRENFIRTEARQMLSDLRSNAVDTLQNLQFRKINYLL